MIFQDLFEQFSQKGSFCTPDKNAAFADIPWSVHPTFDGVQLKTLINGEQTAGQFSYHLVCIAPNKKIGNHIHAERLETHEVIAGSGFCINNDEKIAYAPGVISIMSPKVAHEVWAGSDGLYLFAKFMPAQS